MLHHEDTYVHDASLQDYNCRRRFYERPPEILTVLTYHCSKHLLRVPIQKERIIKFFFVLFKEISLIVNSSNNNPLSRES